MKMFVHESMLPSSPGMTAPVLLFITQEVDKRGSQICLDFIEHLDFIEKL